MIVSYVYIDYFIHLKQLNTKKKKNYIKDTKSFKVRTTIQYYGSLDLEQFLLHNYALYLQLQLQKQVAATLQLQLQLQSQDFIIVATCFCNCNCKYSA